MTPLIVCFGDSLTAGFQSPTRESFQLDTPYGMFLQELLGTTAHVAVSGICGEVTGEMAKRFRRDVLDHRPHSVIILGGTNDLGGNTQPSDIMPNLVNMYESALGAGIHVVPVTVPSLRVDGDLGGFDGEQWLADHISRREMLNHLILAYAASKQLACIDLFAATAEPKSLQLDAQYSNDGLHLTTEGYRLLAKLAYDRVFARQLGET
ncbi:MAG: SGNH/GDSL hydrolase family protein [Nitrospiraceae bacterium]